MLAERKSKEKWTQDPRNTFWSKDKTKFGWRMLERMGWKEEGGLGKEGQGSTDFIKPHKKKDNSGVGAKRGRDEDWIQHQDTFDQLLAGLNSAQGSREGVAQGSGEGAVNEERASKSIIENAGESKRIVYKRFLKSKDLSAASSEEMDCVLGRKRRKRSKPETEEKTPPVEVAATETEVTSHGVTTIKKRQSVSDYFSEKMKKVRSKRTKQTTDKLS